MMMNLGRSVEWLAGEIEVLAENLPQCHFVDHRSYMTWLVLNPARCRWKPTTNLLSYGADPFFKKIYWLWVWVFTICAMIHVCSCKSAFIRVYITSELQSSSADVFALRLTKYLGGVAALLVQNAREKLCVGGRLAQYKIHPSLSSRPCCLPRRGRVQVRGKSGWNWLLYCISTHKSKGMRRRKEWRKSVSVYIFVLSQPKHRKVYWICFRVSYPIFCSLFFFLWI
jgi:hypothetical protein